MQAWMAIAALIVAAVGQYLNSKPQYPAAVVKIGMALMGPILYLMVEQPTGPPGGVAFLEWLDKAWIWALALPGAASLIGIAPNMATRTVAVVLACVLFFNPAPVSAAGASPLEAVSLSVGVSERWLDGGGLPSSHDFEAIGNAALGITNHLDVTGGIAYGFAGAYVRGHADVRISATDVNDPTFNVWLGVGRYFSEQPSDGLNEWAGKAGLGWKPLARLPFILGLTAGYGLDTERRTVTAGLVYPIRMTKGGY